METQTNVHWSRSTACEFIVLFLGKTRFFIPSKIFALPLSANRVSDRHHAVKLRCVQSSPMPSMDLPYHSHAQLLMPPGPVFSAPPLHNSMALNGSVPLPPPPRHPPPTWSQSNKIHKKRGGFNSKRNIRGPSTNVNIKRLRQQNARKTRKYFNKGTFNCTCPHMQKQNVPSPFELPVLPVGAAARPATPRTVPPAPYNSNSFLCHDTGTVSVVFCLV